MMELVGSVGSMERYVVFSNGRFSEAPGVNGVSKGTSTETVICGHENREEFHGLVRVIIIFDGVALFIVTILA